MLTKQTITIEEEYCVKSDEIDLDVEELCDASLYQIPVTRHGRSYIVSDSIMEFAHTGHLIYVFTLKWSG